MKLANPELEPEAWTASELEGADLAEAKTARRVKPLRAAEDECDAVRAEAILGLAQRDQRLALPLLRRELARSSVPMPIFEAAALVADPSLVSDLRAFAAPSGNAPLDRAARDALEACEAAAAGASPPLS